MKIIKEPFAITLFSCPRRPAVRPARVPRLFLLVLLPVFLSFAPACSSMPQKRELQPQTQYLYEPPPPPPAPLESGSTVKNQPLKSPAGGVDTRLADLASQLEALRARLQVVEGKLAEQENQLNQFTRSGSPEQRGQRDQLTTIQRDLAAVQERLARLEAGRAAPSTPSPRPEPPVIQEIPPPAAAKTGGDPFQEGLNLYKQKSYGPAREKLQSYLKDHPKGDKAAEARFYLADSLLQDKKYDEAIVEFNKIVEGSPKSSFAPQALLKQSQAFKAQGKTKIANLVLEKLIADYPKSAEAAQTRRLQGNRP